MVGMIFDISTSPRGHLIVGVEDGTGRLPVLFPKNSEAAKTARTLVLDEVIGVHGRYRSDKGVLVASEVVFPDIDDQTGDLAKEPVVAAFLSDLHYGSDDFMGDAFDSFLSWINGRWGSQDERELAAITRYVLICGDLVERGADLLERYSRLAGLLDEIPREVAIVAIPGEEDTSGVIEPQRGFLEDAARAFSELERFHSGPNPSMVSLSSVPVLLYHGRSLEDWGSTLQGYSTCELMREMLLRRHIAPTYGSAVPIWPTGQDPFIIGEVPRIFHVGHGHKSCTAKYKGVRLITTSSWRSSDRGEGAGGVYLVDLSNLGVRELKFGNQ
jgi:DNA polymerase II small subunit